MLFDLMEELVSTISGVDSEIHLHRALKSASERMGFDHFSLAYDKPSSRNDLRGMLVHDYPDEWAKVYVGFDLGGADPPVLSERQRECVLWCARGKTAGETAAILGISEVTVVRHLKIARERYDVHSGQVLILCALFDGLIGFGDVFDWWRN